MIESLLYIILAAIGLGFLIFIHELGHYWMARRVGMRVETFSIGFGKPVYVWEWQGVRWQVGWLPFGGYVKIAGMEPEENGDNEKISGGFYSKGPLARIKVVIMGPLVNLVFAFLAFTVIWVTGGRTKNYSEFTNTIGWVDLRSELYSHGVRPGDDITAYGTAQFSGAKDHIYAPITSDKEILVQGKHVDYKTGDKIPFAYRVNVYSNPLSLDEGIKTAGILSSASYLIYQPSSGKVAEDPTVEGSPMYGSGIEEGDRIVWVDGERIFSLMQLKHALNDHRVLVTVQRGSEVFLRRIPRVPIEELKLDYMTREELSDWQHEAHLGNKKFKKLYSIPYNITPFCIVEQKYNFIDKETEQEVFPHKLFSPIEEPLQPGDRIIAVDGVEVNYAYQLFAQIQERKVNIIVERDPQALAKANWIQGKDQFEKEVSFDDIELIANSIGSASPVRASSNLHLLNRVIPVKKSEIALSAEKQATLAEETQEEKKGIEAIENPEKRAQIMRLFEENQNRLMLGVPVRDRQVVYNPNPFDQFEIVFQEIWRTLTALLSGSLNPKWVSGPVGIVQIVQESWGISLHEVLFWLGAISLNLGVLNLLPIPVLDGGYILIFLYEMITRRKMKRKTMERLIIPFIVLVVGFLFYVTYNDITRIINHFFKM